MIPGMAGHVGRDSDARARLEREAWLRALANQVRLGAYRPDPDRIAEALMRAWCRPAARSTGR